MSNQQHRRQQLYELLSELPDRECPIEVTTVGTEERDKYALEKLLLDLNGIEPVPAYFVRPLGESTPRPTILYNHAHGGDYVRGKDELLEGQSALQNPPYAEVLTAMGCNVLCFDHWAFGERRGRTESEIFKEMLWRGQVMWGMMVFDSLRALDYLASRPDVDVSRLGTLGIAMGSTMAWWLAALDARVKVCIDMCCLTDFQTLIESQGLDGHGIYYYVPELLKHFTTSQINELIAPRAHLSLAGNYDLLTPPAGLDRIDQHLRKVYQKHGAPEAWKLLRYNIGHFETAAMRAEIISFLQQWL